MKNITGLIKKRLHPQQGEGLRAANTRVLSAKVLQQVIQYQVSLRKLFQEQLQLNVEQIEPGLFKEMTFGSIRWYYKLDFIVKKLLNKPIENKYLDIHFLLIIGIYQLEFLNIPEYAIVNETVNAAKLLNRPWATKLVNRILRSYIRQRDKLRRASNETLVSQYAHPIWMIELLQKVWPKHWESILVANNVRPPLAIRVNVLQHTRDDYRALLAEAGISTSVVDDFPSALVVDRPVPVTSLLNFSTGACSVQDLAGQRVVELLDLAAGQNVLDACAAPGSKTCHLVESQPDLNKLVAIDIDAARLLRIKKNLSRLQLNQGLLKLVLDDAAHTRQWWDGVEFDRILLDAPCSASGVIRRHPDIKHLRKPGDIEEHAQLQLHLLTSLWPLVKKGGKLLYTTCSVFPQENDCVLKSFLQKNKDATVLPIDFEKGVSTEFGFQYLPTHNGPDGFYYCLLQK